MAEWSRRWTAIPIRFPLVGSKPISVGILLGTDRKHKYAELQAPQSEQQTQCLDKNQFVKTPNKKLAKVSAL